MIKFKVLKENDFEKRKIFGHDHICYEFNKTTNYKRSIIATMHQIENGTNLEVLKFALWCRKNQTKLIMYGLINQLPLFSIFADSAILQNNENWASDLYPKPDNLDGSTTNYRRYEVFKHFNESIDLDHCNEKVWPQWLWTALDEASDDEVVANFTYPTIYIRQNAVDTYNKLVADNIIQKNLVMCEAKVDHCTGPTLLSVFQNATKKANFDLPICCDLGFRRRLAELCGQDYMSTQLLASAFSNWIWICYGGASNIFPFFPIKLVAISDVHCKYDLIRKLFQARFGEIGKVLPEFEGLIFCFPGEVDGPSRTDGHRPLPNLQKLTKDLSNHKLNAQLL
jgi:hypothetical protein